MGKRLLLLLLLLPAALLLLGCALQEKLLFYPRSLPADLTFSAPAGAPFSLTEIRLPVAGAELSGAHLALPRPRGALLFLHGNAGALDNWLPTVAPLTGLGWDVYVFDYRGFGKSSGHIRSQAELLADSEAMFARVRADFPAGPIVPVGYSIGRGLAAHLAQRERLPTVILLAPYFSLAELVREKAPWLPSFLLRYPLPSADYLAAAPGTVTLIHGTADSLIPPAHSQRLQKRLGARARLVLLPADHQSLLSAPGLLPALAEALPPAPSSPTP